MTASNLVRHADTTNTPGVLSEPVPNERIVPVWLSLEDLDVIEHVLRHFPASGEDNADLPRHLADLQKHFAWVRSEFTASGSSA